MHLRCEQINFWEYLIRFVINVLYSYSNIAPIVYWIHAISMIKIDPCKWYSEAARMPCCKRFVKYTSLPWFPCVTCSCQNMQNKTCQIAYQLMFACSAVENSQNISCHIVFYNFTNDTPKNICVKQNIGMEHGVVIFITNKLLIPRSSLGVCRLECIFQLCHANGTEVPRKQYHRSGPYEDFHLSNLILQDYLPWRVGLQNPLSEGQPTDCYFSRKSNKEGDATAVFFWHVTVVPCFQVVLYA